MQAPNDQLVVRSFLLPARSGQVAPRNDQVKARSEQVGVPNEQLEAPRLQLVAPSLQNGVETRPFASRRCTMSCACYPNGANGRREGSRLYIVLPRPHRRRGQGHAVEGGHGRVHGGFGGAGVGGGVGGFGGEDGLHLPGNDRLLGGRGGGDGE